MRAKRGLTWTLVVVAVSAGVALLVATTHAANVPQYSATALMPAVVGDSLPGALAANGMVVGSIDAADGWLHPFVWTAKDGIVILDNPTGSEDCNAVAVDEAGHIAGQCINAGVSDAGWRAYLWTKNGDVVPLASPEGAWACSPHSVNNAGQILGQCELDSADHTSVAVVWTR